MPNPGIIILLACLFLLLVIAAEHGARRWGVPLPLWMLLLGLGYGLTNGMTDGTLPSIAFSPDWVVFGFLPLLIFTAARKIPVRTLLAEGPEIAALSLAGPLLCMVLLAAPLVFIGDWAWSHALLFGAALAPTDPLAVGAVLGKQGISERLKVLIEGESLFNDALAIVLFALLSQVAVKHSTPGLAMTLGELAYALGGAVVLGVAAGAATGAILRWWHDLHDRFAGAVLPLVLVYALFVFAHDVLHVSGVVAAVVATLTLGAMHTHRDQETRTERRTDNFFDDFWQFLDTMAGAVLFFVMGAMVGRHEWLLPWMLVPLVCLALLVARAVAVYPLGFLAQLAHRTFPLSWRHVLVAGGLRGGLSVALLLSLPANYEHRTAMVCLAFALLLFSLTVFLLFSKLYLNKGKLLMVLAVVLFVPAVYAGGGSEGEAFRDDFANQDAWKPLTFPKIERDSRYSIITNDGNSVLKAEADDSASGLVSKEPFDPYQNPILRWRWRVENVLKKGNAERKDGDDYPLRVYVLFEYDPERASFGMRMKYALAKRFHGEYPPHAALNYIWANRRHKQRILPSPYTERSQLVILRAGRADTGEWLEEEVNILRDYRAAFDEDPPRTARLAIMSDADNSGEKALGFVDFIELGPELQK